MSPEKYRYLSQGHIKVDSKDDIKDMKNLNVRI